MIYYNKNSNITFYKRRTVSHPYDPSKLIIDKYEARSYIHFTKPIICSHKKVRRNEQWYPRFKYYDASRQLTYNSNYYTYDRIATCCDTENILFGSSKFTFRTEPQDNLMKLNGITRRDDFAINSNSYFSLISTITPIESLVESPIKKSGKDIETRFSIKKNSFKKSFRKFKNFVQCKWEARKGKAKSKDIKIIGNNENKLDLSLPVVRARMNHCFPLEQSPLVVEEFSDSEWISSSEISNSYIDFEQSSTSITPSPLPLSGTNRSQHYMAIMHMTLLSLSS